MNKKYIDGLVNKLLKETIEEKADDLVGKLKTNMNEMGGMEDKHPTFGELNFSTMSDEEIEAKLDELLADYDDEEGEGHNEWEEIEGEMEEGFDDFETKFSRKGKDFSTKEFKKFPKHISHKNLEDDSLSLDKFNKKYGHDDYEEDDFDFELNEGDGEVCECGGSLYEGECTECGKSYMEEGIHDVEDLNDDNEFDYVQEEEVRESNGVNVQGCEAAKEVIKSQNGEITDIDRQVMKNYNCPPLEEELKGGQRKLDKNKNNKIDAEDFKLLRKDKKTVKESKKTTFTLTENQLVDLIEKIILEQEKLKGTGEGEAKGLTKYKEIHKKDGKDAKEYLDSVSKKMKEYTKEGSKGEYNESPKHFPKGNGQLEKMDTKKYTMSKDGDEFIDDFMRPGMENLEYDEIQPNEEWMEDNIKGSSRTGNNPEWANAEETELGEKLNKKRKENKLAKAKKMAYNKAPQPITDKTGEENGGGINIKLENEKPKTEKKLNEEFSKIANLINYNRKTQ
jgi:hypothetical protein